MRPLRGGGLLSLLFSKLFEVGTYKDIKLKDCSSVIDQHHRKIIFHQRVVTYHFRCPLINQRLCKIEDVTGIVKSLLAAMDESFVQIEHQGVLELRISVCLYMVKFIIQR